MVENSYIPGFSGCIEYTSVISQLIKEAKKDKKTKSSSVVRLSQC